MEWDGLSMIEEEDHDQKSTRGATPSRRGSSRRSLRLNGHDLNGDHLHKHADSRPTSSSSSSSGSSVNTRSVTVATSTMSPISQPSQPPKIPHQTQPAKSPKKTLPQSTHRGILEDYDLEAPLENGIQLHSIETLAEMLFSKDHLESIFADPSSLLKFTSFLSFHRPKSVPTLIYYLDVTKSLRALRYANAVAASLEPLPGRDFSSKIPKQMFNSELEDRADKAFEVLLHDDLPAYVTHMYIQAVRPSILTPSMRMQTPATAIPPSQGGPEGLAEVFCLTEPARPDNPIVFVSEAFHWMTQYGMQYVIGRNCRFLQGPHTNPSSIARIRKAVEAGKEHCEVLLNYRRDGSPFLNLLMHSPLCDSSGNIRYFLGAQVDVSGVFSGGADLDSLQRATQLRRQKRASKRQSTTGKDRKHCFQQLSETFDTEELQAVCTHAGRILQGRSEDEHFVDTKWRRPGVLLREPSAEYMDGGIYSGLNSKLNGFYNHYMLVRPYPSLRILFASQSLRIPGLVPSPIMDRIGGSPQIKEELAQALVDGRGVTARIRWLSKSNTEGRSRWIHFTPLLRSDGQIGVWVALLVDDEDHPDTKETKMAPPVQDIQVGRRSHISSGNDLSSGPAAPPHGNSSDHRAKISWSGPEVAPQERKASLNWSSKDAGSDASSLKLSGGTTASSGDTTAESDTDEIYESLEERLAKKRMKEAKRTFQTDGSGDGDGDEAPLAVRPTYKSLDPYSYLNR